MSDNKCGRCGRRLKDPDATYGPICARKMAAEQSTDELKEEPPNEDGQTKKISD